MKLLKKYTFILIMILFSCAVKAPPTGGLEDVIKVHMAADVSPVNGSFGLSSKNSIEINFNENDRIQTQLNHQLIFIQIYL